MAEVLNPVWDALPAARLGEDDFELVVRAHQARIYRVLCCELRDQDAAATLTQECFLRAYQHRDRFRGEASVSTWLIRIALNLAQDYRRNRRQGFWRRLFGKEAADFTTAALKAADDAPSPERVLIARQQLAEVMAAVDTLSPQQRTAFLLRFVEEMGIEDIAQAMGLEPGTVKSHLARAVAALRRLQTRQS